MASIKFYLNKTKDKWGAEESLYAKFTHCYGPGDYRSLKVFPPVPIKVDPEKWNPKTQQLAGKGTATMKLQQRIHAEVGRITRAWEELEKAHAHYRTVPELSELKAKLSGGLQPISTQSYNTLLDLVDLYIDEKRLSFAKKTIEFYDRSIRYILTNFQKDTRQSLRIEHIDLTFFTRFKAYCAGRGCKNQSTNSYLEKLCAVLRHHHSTGTESLRNRINIDFLRVKKLPTSKKGERDHISEEEAVFLFGLDLSTKFSIIRDVYLFMCFTGPRYSDTIGSLRKEANIREVNMNGTTMRVLWFRQQKTKGEEQVIVPLNHICEEIIRRNNPTDEGPLFRQHDRSGTFNRSLRLIFSHLRDFQLYIEDNREAFLANGYESAPHKVRRAARWLQLQEPTPEMAPRLDKALAHIEGLMKKRESVDYVGNERVSEVYERWQKLTAHTGRHSFGSLLASKGATVKEAQKMLGHRISRTTEKYYHIDQEKTVQKVSEMLAVPLMKVG